MKTKVYAACTNSDPLIWTGQDYPTIEHVSVGAERRAGGTIVAVHLPKTALVEADEAQT